MREGSDAFFSSSSRPTFLISRPKSDPSPDNPASGLFPHHCKLWGRELPLLLESQAQLKGLPDTPNEAENHQPISGCKVPQVGTCSVHVPKHMIDPWNYMVHLGEWSNGCLFVLWCTLVSLSCTVILHLFAPFLQADNREHVVQWGPGLALFVFNETYVFSSRLSTVREERGRKFPSMGITSSAMMWSKVLKWTEREQMPLLNNTHKDKSCFPRAAHLLWKPMLMQGITFP